MNSIRIPSPIGNMIAIATTEHLIYLGFEDNSNVRRIPVRLEAEPSLDNPVLNTLSAELSAYFQGKLSKFTIPWEEQGSDFQIRAWQTLRTIPYGETLSYSEQAHRLGNPNARRAVGIANGANQLAIITPCHRVICQSGRVGGYNAGEDRKKWLLNLESHKKL